jgi:release factor glutamine methyltransferase
MERPRSGCALPSRINELVREARERFEAAGIPAIEAALDAELLARDALGWDRATWVARNVEAAPAEFRARFGDLCARRLKREPIAYIRGRQEFYGREFLVSPSVLIPRPETELLVEEALLLMPALRASRPLNVIDVGTGSGCLVVTLALEYANARYFATDISSNALQIARRNAARHGVFDHITFLHGSSFAGAPGPFNIVVTNPPYVAESERPTLAPEVVRYEPEAALFGGEDGLRDIREIIAQSSRLLDDDGSLLMEVGYGQIDRVSAVTNESDTLALVRSRRDLQGIPRVAVIRRCR